MVLIRPLVILFLLPLFWTQLLWSVAHQPSHTHTESSNLCLVFHAWGTNIWERRPFPQESVGGWRKNEVQRMSLAPVGDRKGIRSQKLHPSWNVLLILHRCLLSCLHGAMVLDVWIGSVKRELAKGRFPLPEFTTRVHGPSWRVSKNAPEFLGHQLGPWTRAVNSGSGNRP